MNHTPPGFFTQSLWQAVLAAALTGLAALFLGRQAEQKTVRIPIERESDKSARR